MSTIWELSSEESSRNFPYAFGLRMWQGQNKPRRFGDHAISQSPPSPTRTQLDLVMDSKVIDRAGIAGRFDIHLEVTPADLQMQFVAGRTVDQPGQSTAADRTAARLLGDHLVNDARKTATK